MKNLLRQIGLWHGQMELSCVGPNQNRTPILGLRKLGPKGRGKVSLRGHAHALSASQRVGW
jgi:hypothetical protein